MMADELDMPYERTTCIMGSTDVTPDQGGSGGSDAIQTDGWPMRRVAAEARRVLLEMASTTLAVPVDQLAVSNGVITVKADPSKRVTYGELVGGKRFNVTLTRQQRRCDDRHREGEARSGFQDRRSVAAALRHPGKSRRFAEVGRRHESAGHGARAQREASVRGRDARPHRRSVCQAAFPGSSRW